MMLLGKVRFGPARICNVWLRTKNLFDLSTALAVTGMRPVRPPYGELILSANRIWGTGTYVVKVLKVS